MLTKDELDGLEAMVRRVVREEITTLGTALAVLLKDKMPTPEQVAELEKTWQFSPQVQKEKSILP